MRVLLIAYVWPEPQSSAAGTRDFQLIRALLDAGHSVTVASSAQDSGVPPCRPRLEQMGVSTYTTALNDAHFDAWVRELDPNAVIFDRFVTEEQFGGRVFEQCPNALRVVDTQDLHFLRRAREKSPDLTWDELLTLDTPDLRREIASIYRSDWTLILSSFEYRLLTKNYEIPNRLLSLTRFFLDLADSSATRLRERSFAERSDFVFIGNFRHAPNWDAVRWLSQTLWPEILRQWKVLGIDGAAPRLLIYGAYPPKEAMQLNDPTRGFCILGQAPDALEVLGQARVSLAPLRFGAGIKGKIAESFWVGTPVVTTEIGCEGMTDTETWGGGVFDSKTADAPIRCARLALEYYLQPQRWAMAQRSGWQILQKEYDQNLNGAAWVRELTDRVEKIQEGRQLNRVGRLLWEQERRSTLYFSRWLELKELAEGKRKQ